MHYDVVLFDLPGTMGSDGVIATISALDYLFVPIKADRLVLESTLNFATTVNDCLIKTGISNLKALCMFWNMVDRRERTVLYDIYQQGFSLLGLDCLQTRVPVRSNFHQRPLHYGRPGLPEHPVCTGCGLYEGVRL